MTAAGLDEIIAASSQVLASAMALPLFRAGVYLGQPRLIERGCTSARRVTHSALARQRQRGLRFCRDAEAFERREAGPLRLVWRRTAEARDAYALLAADKGPEAGRTAADAVRFLRGPLPEESPPRCARRRPRLARLPGRLGAARQRRAPSHLPGGRDGANTAERDNDAFLRGVQAVRPVAHNP